MATQLHFAIDAFTLQLLLKSPKRLVYIIVANDNLHKKATLQNRICTANIGGLKPKTKPRRYKRRGREDAPLATDSPKSKEKALIKREALSRIG